jgi:hypothetical protein
MKELIISPFENDSTSLRTLPRLRLGHITGYICLTAFAQILPHFVPQNFRYTRNVRWHAQWEAEE